MSMGFRGFRGFRSAGLHGLGLWTRAWVKGSNILLTDLEDAGTVLAVVGHDAGATPKGVRKGPRKPCILSPVGSQPCHLAAHQSPPTPPHPKTQSAPRRTS
eukprot:3548466-Pyramimonas_sp.AAC.1